MEILLSCLLLIAGFVALIKGVNWFVDGSSGLAANFKVPSVIIGLTIVAMGTSAPELAVSTSAALAGSNEIALSNVVGSNIFNQLEVLGICALIHPIPIDKTIMKRDYSISVILSFVTLLAVGLGFVLSGNFAETGMLDNVGEVSRPYGIILLVLFAAYIAMLIIQARKDRKQEDETEPMPIWKCILLILVGHLCIIVGGQFVVDNAKKIAAAAGMSETLIGLTIVAIGTSLPELVTSIVAARKGEVELAVGNVVGSNLANLLLILGVSSAIHPITVNLASVFDLCILLVISVLTYIFSLTSRRIVRWEGAAMVLVYAADVVFAILR